MYVKKEEKPLVLKEFLSYLLVIRGYSINTIKSYESDLLNFFSFIKEYLEIAISIKDFNVFILSMVTEKDILAFLVYLNYSKDNTVVTRKRKVSAIRSFYKWLFNTYDIGANIENPSKDIPYMQSVKKIPKNLSLKEAKKIINIFNITNSQMPKRNNTIIAILLNCGLRISEISNLNISNINFKEKYFRIIGKGNKERIVYYNTYVEKQLKDYLNKRKIINLNEPVFINHSSNRLGIDGIENVCKKAFQLAGLEENGYTAHSLRHTMATLLYKYSNTDILVIKEILGHASICSTQIYTHIYNKEIQEAYNKNPLNNFELKKVA
jgi:site-specific recombinase XerD